MTKGVHENLLKPPSTFLHHSKGGKHRRTETVTRSSGTAKPFHATSLHSGCVISRGVTCVRLSSVHLAL